MAADFDTLFERWFQARQWTPFDFQVELSGAYRRGCQGLLNAPTGSGKTYAMFIPALCDALQEPYKPGVKIIWVTPLRALANDLAKALQYACDTLQSGWQVGLRTGDTEARLKAQQRKQLPDVLITTPESLHVLFCLKEHAPLFGRLRVVVADEWHELLGSKRGVQVELALAHLRTLAPDMRTWGISATIGNLVEAAEVLVGKNTQPEQTVIVQSGISKEILVHTVFPEHVDVLPWAGHIGLKLLPQLVNVIWSARTTILFTNTRAMAEIWYHQLLQYDEELAGQLAMHHGSLSREVRDWVEQSLHEGSLKAVVATSSLDLGVDFRPVDTVVQIGSPKGIARFTQRAGRSGHQPGAVSQIYFIPTHALELLEVAALKEAIALKQVERREPLALCFDVLIQYLVTLSIGGGFHGEQLYTEIRSTAAFHHITREEWKWCLQFISKGGKAFEAYDQFTKVVEVDGMYTIANKTMAMRHRLQIGTIVSDPMVHISLLKGHRLGAIEEYFIARLKPGDVFWFAGLCLEFLHIKDMTAYVRKTKERKAATASYQGGRMPLSGYLAETMRHQLNQAADLATTLPEYKFLEPLLNLQGRRSAIPASHELLVEICESNEGYHLFMYPFEGRLMHEILAGLVAYRISLLQAVSISVAMNDYGFELLCNKPISPNESEIRQWLDPHHLEQDVFNTVNALEMARRKFRDIAVIAGLVFQGYPGKLKKNRHLQSSSQLLFDVLSEYEPDHLLLRQSMEETISDQMDQARLRRILIRLQQCSILIRQTHRFSPFSFPLVVDSLSREKVSSESLADRIRQMIAANSD